MTRIVVYCVSYLRLVAVLPPIIGIRSTIYAVFGLASDLDSLLLHPYYERNDSELYTGVVKAFIQRDDILTY